VFTRAVFAWAPIGAAFIMAALIVEPMCAEAWPWALAPLPLVQLSQPRGITTASHADITLTRPAIRRSI